MRTLPTEPKPGDRISATLIRDIIRAIRERTIIQGPGMKVSPGPNGTVVSAVTSASSVLQPTTYWKFSKKENDEGEDEGGWHNQVIQIGVRVWNFNKPDDGFTDETDLEDGDHYLLIDFTKNGKEMAKIVRTEKDAGTADIEDRANGILAVYLGTVEDGKQTRGIYWPPVIYQYL